jgi:hypothetical protein
MGRRLRITFDVLVIAISLAVAAAFVVEWVSHGYPIFDVVAGMPGTRRRFFPWLAVSLTAVLVAVVAAIDAYIHFKRSAK